jgi:hypothetical protein
MCALSRQPPIRTRQRGDRKRPYTHLIVTAVLDREKVMQALKSSSVPGAQQPLTLPMPTSEDHFDALPLHPLARRNQG